MTAPLTILDRMTALFDELTNAASEAEYDAIIDSGLEDAIAKAFVAVRDLPEWHRFNPETRAEREADYRYDLRLGK